MVTDKGNKRLPPYVSYRTFRNFVDGLQQGIPARIDRSYWGDKWSGSTGTQLMAAIRFLGLADANGVPTSRLRQLVSARSAQRSEILKQVATEAFSIFFQGSFDYQTATYAQLEEVLHDSFQLTNDVARKCIKFFIGLAGDASIPLSPFVTRKSKTSPGTKWNVKKRSPRTEKNLPIPKISEEIPNLMSWDKALLTKFPAFDVAWSDEIKLKWFEGFNELMKRFLANTNRD